jgi:lysyl-tRNA synthetase class 2
MAEREDLEFKRPVIELRCRIIQALRSFFLGQGFIEIQTPLLTPSPAPELNIEAIRSDQGMFLATSPELYMKRLLAAGYEKIYQISPVFRRGEQGRLHHPEFTMLEWYRLGADYNVLQDDCCGLIRTVWESLGRLNPCHQDRQLEVSGEWQRLSVQEAFRRYAGWEPGPEPDAFRFDSDLVQRVEPHLGFPTPCFLVDFPAGQAALSRLKSGDPTVAERFELYWAGIELANGFSELTDAQEQRARFQQVLDTQKANGHHQPYPMPESFLKSLEYLGPCAGIALGVDRLVMLLSGSNHLDNVVAFSPSML